MFRLKWNLTESTVEDEGVFASDLLDEIGDVAGERVAGEMKGATYVSIIAPLIVPTIQSI